MIDWQAIGTIAGVIVTILIAGIMVSHSLGELQGTIAGEIKLLKKEMKSTCDSQKEDHGLLINHDRRLTTIEGEIKHFGGTT